MYATRHIRTVVGIHPTKADVLKMLSLAGFSIGGTEERLINDPAFTLTQGPTKVRLQQLTLDDLKITGDPHDVPYAQICANGLRQGLRRCRPDVAPYLRVESSGEGRLIICMEPIRLKLELVVPAELESSEERRAWGEKHDFTNAHGGYDHIFSLWGRNAKHKGPLVARRQLTKFEPEDTFLFEE